MTLGAHASITENLPRAGARWQAPLTEIYTSNLVSRRQPKKGNRIVAWYKLERELGVSSGFTQNYSPQISVSGTGPTHTP